MKLPTRLLILATALTLAQPAPGQSSVATEPVQDAERAALTPPPAMIDQGRRIAEASCARCHGMDGLSTEPDKPNLAGQRAVYLYRVIQAYQNGHRMDASMAHVSGFLNQEGMLSVAAYYANLPPERTNPPGEDAAAQQVLTDDPFGDIRSNLRKCTRCHEETGNSTTSGVPNLTAQHPDYFKHAMQAYAEGSRSHRIMKKLAGRLDESTLQKMGVYYAVQDPRPSDNRGDGNALEGRKLAEDCATCHGNDGNAAKTDVPTLAGQDARYFVKAMNAYLHGEREHEGMFKAVEGLSEEDFANLAAFYASRQPVRRDVRMPLTAAEWIERCERCHGPGGNSTDPRFPMLAGQNPGYLADALQAYSTNARDDSAMHAMASPLSESDISSLAAYFASKEPKSVLYIQLPCGESGSE